MADISISAIILQNNGYFFDRKFCFCKESSLQKAKILYNKTDGLERLQLCAKRSGREVRAMGLRFRKGDLLAVGATILLAIVVFAIFLPGRTEGAAIAQIYQDNVLVNTVSLDEDQEFTLTGQYDTTITVRDGKIAVTRSDCPGEDCVHSGWSNSSGRSIVCLPNRVEIRILSDTDDVDFVVG